MALTDSNRVDLDRQITYTGMDAGTGDILRMVKPTILSVLPGILEQFYERTMAAPELAAKFASPETLRFAREAQAKHWAMLFDGRFDAAYQDPRGEWAGSPSHRSDAATVRLGLRVRPG